MATRSKKASSKGGGSAVSAVLKLAKDGGAKIVDYRFTDMPGMWQHFSSPIGTLGADTFAEGVGFDGSSIRGFQAINESDMLLMPDPDTAFMDPFLEIPTLVLEAARRLALLGFDGHLVSGQEDLLVSEPLR